MPKGTKVCPDCGAEMGPRTAKCATCGHVFFLTKAEKEALTTAVTVDAPAPVAAE